MPVSTSVDTINIYDDLSGPMNNNQDMPSAMKPTYNPSTGGRVETFPLMLFVGMISTICLLVLVGLWCEIQRSKRRILILTTPYAEKGSADTAATHPLLFLHQMKYLWDVPNESEKVHLLTCNEKQQHNEYLPTRIHNTHNVKQSAKNEINCTQTKAKHKLPYFVSIPEETKEELSKISNSDLIVNS